MNNPQSGKTFKPKLIVPVMTLGFTLLLAAGVGVFWWPVGVAILFLGLAAIGFISLGKKAADELDD